MKLLIDAFGCDNPSEVIKGCNLALKLNKNLNLIICGNQDSILQTLSEQNADMSRIEILPASEVISNDEQPTIAIRAKKDSSLMVALDRYKNDNTIDGFVSAGSTGALLCGGLYKVGRIKGVDRPSLAPILPTVNDKYVILLDCGANVDCKPHHLLQFAIMGACYMQSIFGVSNPKVALLSNGVEEKKGSELVREAYAMLKQANDQKKINFVGNIEAREILFGGVDVIVADGFSGNIALKSMEGAVGSVMSVLKTEVSKSLRAKIGALIMKPALRKLKSKLDYNRVGGAVLLGLDKIVVKAHGSSNAYAFSCAISQVIAMVSSDFMQTTKKAIEDSL